MPIGHKPLLNWIVKTNLEHERHQKQGNDCRTVPEDRVELGGGPRRALRKKYSAEGGKIMKATETLDRRYEEHMNSHVKPDRLSEVYLDWYKKP